jgi:hypothetical protein
VDLDVEEVVVVIVEVIVAEVVVVEEIRETKKNGFPLPR